MSTFPLQLLSTVGIASSVVFAMFAFGCSIADADEPKADGPDYTRHIQPLLAKHCVRCHGPKLKESELRLDSLSAIKFGGKRGPAVEPGRSAQSPLIKAARGVRPYREMPPDAPSLKDEEIDLLVKWIDSLKEDPEQRPSRRE
jgi:mono/diheme cytochrome c family protein